MYSPRPRPCCPRQIEGCLDFSSGRANAKFRDYLVQNRLQRLRRAFQRNSAAQSAAREIKHVIDQRRHPRHARLHQSENFARGFLLVLFRQHSRAGDMPIVCGVSRRAGRGSIAHKVPKNVRLNHLSRNQ
jgi:hypothetical protein